MQEQVKFAALVERVLNSAIQNFVNADPDRETIAAMRADIRMRMKEMFKRCSFSLAESSVEWLSDEYFKRINFKKTNGEQVSELGQNLILFDQPDIRKLPKGDVEIMSRLFEITDFGDELAEELRRRSG